MHHTPRTGSARSRTGGVHGPAPTAPDPAPTAPGPAPTTPGPAPPASVSSRRYHAGGPSAPVTILRIAFVSLLVQIALAAAACTAAPDVSPLARLRPCTSDEGPVDAYCGTFEVFEDRTAQAGRRISLNIVLLPSLSGEASDPLFFLAGGPGQGAAQLARQVREIFRPVQTDRDIVLVDQRGTGESNPLNCRSETNTLREAMESDEASLERLKACLAGYDADVRHYTTTIAMDDLDDVRAHLGYDRINLYGGSYGTRAALVYLRRHGDRVRSMILDGVAPTDMRLPLFTARDAQRALDKLLADCETDPACQAAQPDLGERVRALLQRLEQAPPRVRLTHPRTGVPEEVVVEARVVATILFGALYNPLTASLVPALVARAEQNDFQGLMALGFANDGADENMSVGMQLSVICSEDAPLVTADDLARETSGTIFGGYLLSGQVKACAIWPKGDVDPSYYEPVVSDVPALVLSGDVDPVTPPGWGEAVAKHLTNARHIVVPATGHGVVATACGQRLVRQFIERASAQDLDTSCVARVRRPPFFLTPAGPDPLGTASSPLPPSNSPPRSGGPSGPRRPASQPSARAAR
jgi:pimeloyl-ACP methyl ester carboxylesterase